MWTYLHTYLYRYLYTYVYLYELHILQNYCDFCTPVCNYACCMVPKHHLRFSSADVRMSDSPSRVWLQHVMHIQEQSEQVGSLMGDAGAALVNVLGGRRYFCVCMYTSIYGHVCTCTHTHAHDERECTNDSGREDGTHTHEHTHTHTHTQTYLHTETDTTRACTHEWICEDFIIFPVSCRGTLHQLSCLYRRWRDTESERETERYVKRDRCV